jgi:DNA-binding MarR family transcriptional regulator
MVQEMPYGTLLSMRSGTSDTARLNASAATVDEASIGLVEMTVAALSATSQLTVLQVRVLLAIDQHGPTNLQDLADRLRISAPSASRLIDRLVDARLLRRGRAVHSRREITLSLTAHGSRVLRTFRQLRQEAIQEVLTRMPPEDQLSLVRGLESFSRVASQVGTYSKEESADHERPGTIPD